MASDIRKFARLGVSLCIMFKKQNRDCGRDYSSSAYIMHNRYSDTTIEGVRKFIPLSGCFVL